MLVLPALAVAGLFAIERESAVLDGVRAWFMPEDNRSTIYVYEAAAPRGR